MYRYDLSGKLVHSYVYDNESMRTVNGVKLRYDDESRLAEESFSYDYNHVGGSATDNYSYLYVYHETMGSVDRMQIFGVGVEGNLYYNYDFFERLTSKSIEFTADGLYAFYNEIGYDFVDNSDDENINHINESILVSQYTSTVKTHAEATSGVTTTYNYTYDELGNITQIADGNGVVQNKYYYDDLNQLTREDNRAKNATYVYEYDDAGNITSKKTYAFTTGTLGTETNTVTYTYGNNWGDLLTNYNGSAITYDIIGNPLTIGSSIGLSWQGRQLQMYSDWTYDITYTYNDDGIRTRKDLYEPGVGYTTRHEYTLSGTQIISETVYLNMSYPENYIELYTLVYIYDEMGAPIGLKYRTPSYANGVFDCYFFEKNLQGDIVAIYNESGTKIGTYTYDAWGNCTVNPTSGYNFILSNNPFRYRGYYYDTETGYYYLQSRYYNPTWGRFINADKYVSTGQGLLGCNMFAYCANNPILYVDYEGHSWSSFWQNVQALGESCLNIAAATISVAGALLVVGAAIGGTIASGGTGAIAIPGAIVVAAECLAIASVALTITGATSITVATFAKKHKSPGSKHESDSTYNDGEVRVDYEVYGDGNGNGNVHVHIGKPKHKLFELKNHIPKRFPIEKSLKKMLDKNPDITYAIEKAIRYVISLGG